MELCLDDETRNQNKNQHFVSFSQSEQENTNQVQEQSDTNRQQVSYQKPYSVAEMKFPSLQQKTLQLYQIYQKNSELILNLRGEIKRLEHIKQQNLYIKYDLPNVDIDQEVSQFHLKSKQTFQQRQQTLTQLKAQYKALNSQQMTNVMLKNKNLSNVLGKYLPINRQIIQVKVDEKAEFLIVLSKQRKKPQKKCAQFFSAKEDQTLNSQNQTFNLENHSTKLKSGPEHGSQAHKISRIRKTGTKQNNQQNKKISEKIKYNIRFLGLSQVFSEFQKRSGPESLNISKRIFYLPIFPQNLVPTNFAFDQQNDKMLILFSSNLIQTYCIKNCEKVEEQKNAKSPATRKDCKLLARNLEDSSIKIDEWIKIILIQFRKRLLYVGSSDGTIRVYQSAYEKGSNFSNYKLRSIVSCLNCKQHIGKIEFISLSKLSQNQVIFSSDSRSLCKVNLQTFKSSVIHTFDQNIINMNSSYIQTQRNYYLNYLANDLKFNPDCKGNLEFQKIKERCQKLLIDSRIGDTYKTQNPSKEEIKFSGYQYQEKAGQNGAQLNFTSKLLFIQKPHKLLYALILANGKIFGL